GRVRASRKARSSARAAWGSIALIARTAVTMVADRMRCPFLRRANTCCIQRSQSQGSSGVTHRMHAKQTHDAPAAAPISFDTLLAVELPGGTVVPAQPYPEARKPALKLVIDFGPVIGRKKSSAQIAEHQ